MKNNLTSDDALTRVFKISKISSFRQLIDAVRVMPYGRNADRKDLSLVWTEQRGSCSSKHAFLKWVADLNRIPNVQLMVCIFKMSAVNTPAVASILRENCLSYIPEAHCYLQVEGQPLDVTFPHSSIQTILPDVLVTKSVSIDYVIEDKITFHQLYLKRWLLEESLAYDFERLWDIREACITALG